jgi:hypothetical protein
MKGVLLCITLVVFLVSLGCSSGNNSLITADDFKPRLPNSSHSLWGLWQFAADPERGKLEITQLRSGEFHLNALPFLEPPPLVNLTLESLEFNGDIIEADVGLRHPFLGLCEFTGFDVCGILITNGSIAGFTDSGLRMSGEGDTRLLNPDGYSRWWNPSEFPSNAGIFGYTDGLLGTPDSFADYNSTLNAYKYFCDDLDDPGDPLSEVTLERRGMFSAGQKNIRHYTIELGTGGLIFNYAVDACWEFPQGSPPWVVPDDFGSEANRVEAWNISITETNNTLWNDGSNNGGDLSLQVDVYDWFSVEMNVVRVESPGNFAMIESATPTGGGAGYSTYEIEIIDATPGEESIELLFSIVSEEEDFGGYINGVNTTAYFTYMAHVSGEPPDEIPKNIPLREGVVPFDIAIDPIDGRVLIIYDDEEVWQYLPSNNYQSPTPNSKYYDCDWGLMDPWPGHEFVVQRGYIDIADSQYAVIDFTWRPQPWTGGGINMGWYDVIDDSGNLVNRLTPIGIYFGTSYPQHGVAAYGEGGADPSYHNRFAAIWGHSLPWDTFYSWSVESNGYSDSPYLVQHHSGGWKYGKQWVVCKWLTGCEVDADDTHIWYLEKNDCYCARFADLTYDSAFCGTGVATDDDEGFNNPRDLTRDADNNLIALDLLTDDTSRLKAFDPTLSTDSIPAESLGGYDLNGVIIGDGFKVDCSDYIHPAHGNLLVVMHGIKDDPDTPNVDEGEYYMSFFGPSELPW